MLTLSDHIKSSVFAESDVSRKMLAYNTTIWDNKGAVDSAVADRPRSRSNKQGISETEKDEKYWERRKRNNISAKRSREKSRQTENLVRNKYIILEEENALLRREIQNIKLRYGISSSEVFLSDEDREECARKVNKIVSQVLRRPKQVGLESAKQVDKKYDNINATHSDCKPRPDTTTSPANLDQLSENESKDEEVTVEVRTQEYLWNRNSEPSPTPQYIFYRPMEDITDSSPADLSVTKKRQFANGENVCNKFIKTSVTADVRTRIPSPATVKSRNERTVESAVVENDVAIKTEALQNSVDNDIQVLNLTKDDDGDASDDDLKTKLKRLSDQIEAMQRFMDHRVRTKND